MYIYIQYKKLFHCDVCNKEINYFDEISSPIFSLQFEDINSIFKHRYTSHVHGCSTCIENNIQSNAYVLISYILLPKYFIVSIELEGINLDSNTFREDLIKARDYSKKY